VFLAYASSWWLTLVNFVFGLSVHLVFVAVCSGNGGFLSVLGVPFMGFCFAQGLLSTFLPGWMLTLQLTLFCLLSCLVGACSPRFFFFLFWPA
jgi:hypothetical protein